MPDWRSIRFGPCQAARISFRVWFCGRRRVVFNEYSGGRKERLFRAAVSAFCALTRPTRDEARQLDDLVLPLVDSVSAEGLRFAAAALGEVERPPVQLVRRLAGEPVEISAPLLMKSKALSDIDLLALVGRHGLAHARAIARRRPLHPTLEALLRSLGALEAPAEADEPAPDALAQTRERLRSMMRPAGPAGTPVRERPSLRWEGAPDPYRKLLSTALTGVPILFQTALCDLAGIAAQEAAALTGSGDAMPLMRALKTLGLSEAEAFLIVICAMPQAAGAPAASATVSLAAIGELLENYRGIATETPQAAGLKAS